MVDNLCLDPTTQNHILCCNILSFFVLGMIGVLEANLYFWIGFTILHIIVCLVLTAQIYYFGYWKLGKL